MPLAVLEMNRQCLPANFRSARRERGTSRWTLVANIRGAASLDKHRLTRQPLEPLSFLSSPTTNFLLSTPVLSTHNTHHAAHTRHGPLA